jgi:hypothetical protein
MKYFKIALLATKLNRKYIRAISKKLSLYLKVPNIVINKEIKLVA